jgi:hypothetical protein
LFGGVDGFVMRKPNVLRDMAEFIAAEQRAKPAAARIT